MQQSSSMCTPKRSLHHGTTGELTRAAGCSICTHPAPCCIFGVCGATCDMCMLMYEL
jgi:hypothetical protein